MSYVGIKDNEAAAKKQMVCLEGPQPEYYTDYYPNISRRAINSKQQMK